MAMVSLLPMVSTVWANPSPGTYASSLATLLTPIWGGPNRVNLVESSGSTPFRLKRTAGGFDPIVQRGRRQTTTSRTFITNHSPSKRENPLCSLVPPRGVCERKLGTFRMCPAGSLSSQQTLCLYLAYVCPLLKSRGLRSLANVRSLPYYIKLIGTITLLRYPPLVSCRD